MTSGLEFEGKNVENAVKNACLKLKIKEDKLKYDVISYGSTGIFGLVGAKKAKIRVVSPKPRSIRKSEGRENRDEKENQENDSVLLDEDREEIKSIVKESFEGIDTGMEKKETAAETKETEGKEIPEELAEGMQENPDDEKIAEKGKEVLNKIVELIADDARVTASKTENKLHLNVTGGSPAVLIGKKGQTLEAIQYIVEKIMNKQFDERIRVQVDVEGYLESRKQNLERLSSRLAEKAKRIGKPVTIGHMNSHDRRIVHLFLKDDNQIRTQSIGDGFYRKLVIFPKKAKKNKNKSK